MTPDMTSYYDIKKAAKKGRPVPKLKPFNVHRHKMSDGFLLSPVPLKQNVHKKTVSLGKLSESLEL
jgi:hypothetical protein